MPMAELALTLAVASGERVALGLGVENVGKAGALAGLAWVHLGGPGGRSGRCRLERDPGDQGAGKRRRGLVRPGAARAELVVTTTGPLTVAPTAAQADRVTLGETTRRPRRCSTARAPDGAGVKFQAQPPLESARLRGAAPGAARPDRVGRHHAVGGIAAGGEAGRPPT